MILRADHISVSFRKERQRKLFGQERQQVLNDVSLTLRRGECLGLVGESGSGKSTLGRVLCGLLKPESGSVWVDGVDLYARGARKERRENGRRIGVVFQDYTTSVNPRFRVRDIIGEALRSLKKRGEERFDHERETTGLLERVGLPESFVGRYPHELSGGQLQRVCIARTVATKPEIIVLDEAVSSLDASSQAQVMDLLIRLRQEYGFSYLFITHDLTAVTYMCDRVAFFKDGAILEQVESVDSLSSVESGYARKLLTSVIGIGDVWGCKYRAS